jgi:hypothetical protein
LIVGGYFDAYSTGDSIAVVPGSDVNSSALNTTEGAVGANDNVG